MVEFVEHTCQLHRREVKNIPNNVVTFRVNAALSKPEIAQYLRKMYELDVKRVNTSVRPGRVAVDYTRGRARKHFVPGDKMAFVVLGEKVDPYFQKIE